jgi:hypothetical protein
MSPPRPPAAGLLKIVRDWDVVTADPKERVMIIHEALSLSSGSQKDWNPEAVGAHQFFGRDVATVELYAAAQEVAALTSAVRLGWRLPTTWNVSRDLRRTVPELDLHGIAHAAYMLATNAPSTETARGAREAYGRTIVGLSTSSRLRRRCLELRPAEPKQERRRRRS